MVSTMDASTGCWTPRRMCRVIRKSSSKHKLFNGDDDVEQDEESGESFVAIQASRRVRFSEDTNEEQPRFVGRRPRAYTEYDLEALVNGLPAADDLLNKAHACAEDTSHDFAQNVDVAEVQPMRRRAHAEHDLEPIIDVWQRKQLERVDSSNKC